LRTVVLVKLINVLFFFNIKPQIPFGFNQVISAVLVFSIEFRDWLRELVWLSP